MVTGTRYRDELLELGSTVDAMTAA
jgi:hypothetical protein